VFGVEASYKVSKLFQRGSLTRPLVPSRLSQRRILSPYIRLSGGPNRCRITFQQVRKVKHTDMLGVHNTGFNFPLGNLVKLFLYKIINRLSRCPLFFWELINQFFTNILIIHSSCNRFMDLGINMMAPAKLSIDFFAQHDHILHRPVNVKLTLTEQVGDDWRNRVSRKPLPDSLTGPITHLAELAQKRIFRLRQLADRLADALKSGR